ncbi:GL12174 [Drosophila persimilis]|uniref:Growth hormone-inducible transmembrane protein n=2 Tax=pseudoobscura subgroup TaxID=32358 RepID=A0A6I8URI4_DROPS|nr:growth hormone-inducible transmembrane protein [Drosophila pseudoobscura]XP_002019526.1 growth hormone-inducible transmembrane protein [Drosophila persimilis]EDW38160.1 GL12174 [Drosophila persimilis]
MLLARLNHVLPGRSLCLLGQVTSQRLWQSTKAMPLLKKNPLTWPSMGQGKSLIPKKDLQNMLRRDYSRESNRNRSHLESRTRGPSLKDRMMGPPSENAYSMGKGAAAGAALMGLVGLCYYGLGLSKQTSVYDQSLLWPQYVRDRIHATYAYFGASCGITAAAAAAFFQSETAMSLMTRSGIVAGLITLGLVMGTGVMAQSIEYKEGFGAKQLAWLAHCTVLGAVLAPMCFLGGPILTRAMLYTGGIVGALSTVAACAPSDKFLYMGGPLAIGLGVVFASSLAGMWLPPTTALGAGLASMSVYGGLILFSGFLLYDTQRIVRVAELHPQHGIPKFDPINMALAIYMDALNIFIRIAMILASDNQRKK